ncbi:MAG: hypothetical protein MZV63_09000 [Marinilabiliales bacterium]|nr:hypothetical protein [Marinilabiliales bacterium]
MKASTEAAELANIAVYPAFYNPKDGYVDLITSMKMDIQIRTITHKGR